MRRGKLNVEKPLGGLGESHSVKRKCSRDVQAVIDLVYVSQRARRRQSRLKRRAIALGSTLTDTKYGHKRRRSLTLTWISTQTCKYV